MSRRGQSVSRGSVLFGCGVCDGVAASTPAAKLVGLRRYLVRAGFPSVGRVFDTVFKFFFLSND